MWHKKCTEQTAAREKKRNNVSRNQRSYACLCIISHHKIHNKLFEKFALLNSFNNSDHSSRVSRKKEITEKNEHNLIKFCRFIKFFMKWEKQNCFKFKVVYCWWMICERTMNKNS